MYYGQGAGRQHRQRLGRTRTGIRRQMLLLEILDQSLHLANLAPRRLDEVTVTVLERYVE